MEFRKITHGERLCIEDAIKNFGTMDLQGGSREVKDGKIIYNLCFDFTHLHATSPEARKVGSVIKNALGADEIWLVGNRIA